MRVAWNQDMPRSRWLDRRYSVLGGSITAPVAFLIGITLVASIVAAQVREVAFAGVLVPGLVFQGQAWRLFTWVLFEQDPLGLIFAGLALFWFGNDLARVWGPGRFLLVYFGLAGAAAVVTCLFALAFPGLGMTPYAGPWAVVDALIIAWALSFPTRNIFVYFVLPLSGKNLIWATLGGTLLYGLLGGIGRFIPHFAAQLLTLAVLRGAPVDIWRKIRFELAYRGWRRRASRLREVPPRSSGDNPRWYH
jgi:membrane associated rhomboid family serine protease